MIHFQEFNYLLRKLQHSDGPSEIVAALKNVATAIQAGDKNDLQELLELLNSTPDYKLKVKLLSILSAYLISHNRFCDAIVTYRPLYDIIQNLLCRGLPMKTLRHSLNFILALLTTSSKPNLKIFAQNMLRISGCLMTMCDIFTSGMICQDTWIPLCQSIAESCSGCEINQSFCSRLISVCVEKCCLGNTDVCIVLQCLVNNHQRNTQLFFESGGESIFTRQLLQHDTCMQMLTNIVQTSEHAVKFLYSSGLVYHLRDVLHMYGPYSQVGQWSTIVLYHLNNRIKGSGNTFKNMTNEKNHDIETSEHSNLSFRQTIGKQITNGNVNIKQFATRVDRITKDDIKFTNMEQAKKKFIVEELDKRHATNDIKKAPIDDDTMNLFQNVIREVIYWKSKSELNPNNQFTSIIGTNKCHQNERQHFKKNRSYKLQNTKLRAHPKDNINFSDLSREFDVNNELFAPFPTNKYFGKTGQMSNPCFNFTKESNNLVQTEFKMNMTINPSVFQYSKAKHSDIDLKDFKPTFVSTPKRQYQKGNLSIQTKLQNTTKISHASQGVRLCRSRISKLYKTNKSKITQTTLNTTKDVKQISMSARFLSAINDSCTTLVKSVKSIFTLKKDYNKNNENSNIGNNDKKYEVNSCSYSFTNYMRKRDAVLLNEDTQTENNEFDFNSIDKDSCRTCKDTIVLQHKMATDEHLQQTIKRLKIGVNLYGCNFKKISKTLWPRDRYMTPNMLHNLYRKLIINGSQKQKFLENN